MLAVVFLLAIIYMSSKMVRCGTDPDVINNLLKETHKYSGINGILYREFLANINMAREFSGHEDISRKLLERAMHNIEELGLYVTSTDTSVAEELNEIMNKITIEFEYMYRRT